MRRIRVPGAGAGFGSGAVHRLLRPASQEWLEAYRSEIESQMSDRASDPGVVAACDVLLTDSGRSVARVAVPWLHGLSDHPAATARRAELVAAAGFGKARLRKVARLARTAARAAFRREPDGYLDGVGDRDVLLVSHLVDGHPPAPDGDFYFGALAPALSAENLTSLTVLRNHVPGPEGTLAARARLDGPHARRLLPRVGGLAAEFAAWRTARDEAAVLASRARAASDPDARSAARVAASDATSEGTLANLRLHRQIRALCRTTRPRAVIVTFEGHAWERIAFHAARSVRPDVLCIAYQHTVLFPGAHGVRRPLGAPYDPDVVLTTGEVNRARLEADWPRVVVYGSHRRAAVPLEPAADASDRVLVVPEGLPSECAVLCDLTWALARRCPDVEFLARFHPVLPFERLARMVPRLRERPANVVLSAGSSLATDARRCRWTLYRGSSAVFQTVLAGARPLHFRRPGDPDIDPLAPMDGWREVVGSADDVHATISRDRAVDTAAWIERGAGARAFCDRIMEPADPGVVAALLRLEPTPGRG